MTKEELKNKFIKQVKNAYSCQSIYGGPQLYRRPDLCELSAIAYENGEKLFYADLEEEGNIYSKMVSAKPRIEYAVVLTEEEFNEYFNEGEKYEK